MFGAMLGGRDLDLHSADRIDLEGNDGHGLGLLGAAQLDDLREDAQRDLFGKARAVATVDGEAAAKVRLHRARRRLRERLFPKLGEENAHAV